MVLKTSALLAAALLVEPWGVARAQLDTSPDGWQAAAAIKVARSDRYGAYLTDGKGLPLYAFSGDEHGESSCYSDCARIWPPFVSATAPELSDPSLDHGSVGAIIRSDGARQVTYAGHPLYRYVDDAGGEPHGQRVTQFGGEWHLLSPAGRPIGR